MLFRHYHVWVLGGTAPAPKGKVAEAKPGDVRVIASNGIREPLEAVRADAEKTLGHHFVVEYGSSMGLKATIDSGVPFEVAIVTPAVLDDEAAQGKIVAGSKFEVGRAAIGMAQHGDMPKCDISNAASFKKALLGAASIRFAGNGAALPSINKFTKELGIADEFKAKANIKGFNLAPGQYELTIYPVSELPSDWIYLGPIPKEFDLPAIMAAGIGSGGDAKLAKALIDFLKGPAIEPSLKENRMTR